MLFKLSMGCVAKGEGAGSCFLHAVKMNSKIIVRGRVFFICGTLSFCSNHFVNCCCAGTATARFATSRTNAVFKWIDIHPAVLMELVFVVRKSPEVSPVNQGTRVVPAVSKCISIDLGYLDPYIDGGNLRILCIGWFKPVVNGPGLCTVIIYKQDIDT